MTSFPLCIIFLLYCYTELDNDTLIYHNFPPKSGKCQPIQSYHPNATFFSPDMGLTWSSWLQILKTIQPFFVPQPPKQLELPAHVTVPGFQESFNKPQLLGPEARLLSSLIAHFDLFLWVCQISAHICHSQCVDSAPITFRPACHLNTWESERQMF